MDISSVRAKMQQAVDLISGDVATIRTGRASPGLLADLSVSVYGGQQKLKINELASVISPDPQSLTIDPWDKSIIGEIKKGIESANIGLTPSIDGEVVRISVPPLTSEDKEKLVKILSTKIENGKVMVRQIRGDGMQNIRESFESKEISEDEKFRQEKELQKVTDEFTQELEEIKKNKEEDLLRV